jgi:hypothetical protein
MHQARASSKAFCGPSAGLALRPRLLGVPIRKVAHALAREARQPGQLGGTDACLHCARDQRGEFVRGRPLGLDRFAPALADRGQLLSKVVRLGHACTVLDIRPLSKYLVLHLHKCGRPAYDRPPACTDNFDNVTFELHDIRDAGNRVVAHAVMTGETKDSAVSTRQPMGIVYSDFHNGLIGELRYFPSWHDALKAVGLAE